MATTWNNCKTPYFFYIQGSRWLFQATRMNGELFGFQIPPDMFQVVNPILILIFIPVFDYWVYPLLGNDMIHSFTDCFCSFEKSVCDLVKPLTKSSIYFFCYSKNSSLSYWSTANSTWGNFGSSSICGQWRIRISFEGKSDFSGHTSNF